MQEEVQKRGRSFRREFRKLEGGAGGSRENRKEFQEGVEKRRRRCRRE